MESSLRPHFWYGHGWCHHGTIVDILGCCVVQRGVGSVAIVEVNGLGYGHASLGLVVKDLAVPALLALLLGLGLSAIFWLPAILEQPYVRADQWLAGTYDGVVRGLLEQGWMPDYLFNFAGIAHPGYFQELPIDIFRRTMEVNFFGTLHTAKVIAPLMMARRQGHIINTSSVAGLVGVFGYSAYGASKFAVKGFSDVLRSEMHPYGVRVSVLFPPDTDTPQLAYEDPFKPAETRALSGNVKVMSPETVARQLLAGVKRGRYLIIPGLESKLVYMAAGLLGAKMHWFLDVMVRNAQAKAGGPPPIRRELLGELYGPHRPWDEDGNG